MAGVDPVTSRAWGGEIDRFNSVLVTAGFAVGDDAEWGPGLRALPIAQRAVLALEVVLGVRLESSALEGPWWNGLSDS